uniref:Uncharacterized protein n=1 Tax=Cucumis sativus TaxID=3659 RepID=A0A0A0KCV9_CUCSA
MDSETKSWNGLQEQIGIRQDGCFLCQESCQNMVDLNTMKAFCKSVRHTTKLDVIEKKTEEWQQWLSSSFFADSDPKDGLSLNRAITNQPADRNLRNVQRLQVN